MEGFIYKDEYIKANRYIDSVVLGNTECYIRFNAFFFGSIECAIVFERIRKKYRFNEANNIEYFDPKEIHLDTSIKICDLIKHFNRLKKLSIIDFQQDEDFIAVTFFNEDRYKNNLRNYLNYYFLISETGCSEILPYSDDLEIPELEFVSTGNIEIENTASLSKQGYVYLMVDTTNGFYKIGFSTKPKYRESTLQAEKPTIELLWKTKGDLELEKQLHEKFAQYRIRGEWFDLTDTDIEYITKTFPNSKDN
jgi:hypothetical protein